MALFKFLNKTISWLHSALPGLLQTEPRRIPDKPGQMAYRMDRYGGRIVCLVVILLLLLQFELSLGVASLGAIGLTLALYYSLKKGKPRLVLRRSSVVHKVAGDSGIADLGSDVPGSKRRFWGQVLTGLVLIGLGWVWNGGWGVYFIGLGLINLFLAGLVLVGEKKMKTIQKTQIQP
jgi:hypothetical protein